MYTSYTGKNEAKNLAVSCTAYNLYTAIVRNTTFQPMVFIKRLHYVTDPEATVLQTS